MKKTEFIALVKQALTDVDNIPTSTTTLPTDEVDADLVAPVVELVAKIKSRIPGAPPEKTDPVIPTDGTQVDVTNDL